MYDHMTVQGATFNMRGQLYHGHANATALFSSPLVSALSRVGRPEFWSWPGQGVVPLRHVEEKKIRSAFRLG